MGDIHIRIIILWLMVIVTMGYIDFLPKISQIQQLNETLHELRKKKIISNIKPNNIFIEEHFSSEDIVNNFMTYLHRAGFYIKKLQNVSQDDKDGFQKTNFSLQMIGDFIPFVTMLHDFSMPILLQHFSIVIDNGVANVTAQLSILHMKNTQAHVSAHVGTVKQNSKNFRIMISPDDNVHWRKI